MHEIELKDVKNGAALLNPANIQTDSPKFNSNSKFLWKVAITSSLTAFHFGYAISSINVPSSLFINYPPSSETSLFKCFHVSQSAWGLVGLGLPLGGWIGGFSAPKMIKLSSGVKPAIEYLNMILVIGYLFMGLAINLPMLVIGRCLLGFVSGASGMMIPLYLSSITPPKSRGFFTNFFQLFLCGGIVIAEIISLVTNVGKHDWIWRFTFSAGLVIILLQVVLDLIFGYLPQSPRDLDQSSPSEALILRHKLGHEPNSLNSLNNDGHVGHVGSKESNSIVVPEIINSRNHHSLWNLITFRIPEANRSLLVGILLHAGQQVSGVNAIFFYSSMIIEGSQKTPLLLALINFGMTLVAIWLLDRAGRRPVALFSVAGSSICLIAISLTFTSFKTVASLFLLSFVACFSLGLGPIPWMIIPEIFPPNWNLTPTASSICVSANWITNIVVTGAFPSLTEIAPVKVIFFTFGISCLLLLFGLSYILPETKNRPSNFI